MSGRPANVTHERKDIYTQEFKTLLAYIKKDTKLKPRTKNNAKKAFYLLYYFGFRVGEIVLFKNSAIRKMVTEKVISLGNDTKTKTPREAYVADEHVATLKRVFKDELNSPYADHSVFSPTINQYNYYNKVALRRLLNNVIQKALGKQYSTHSFRAGYITKLHRANVSIKTISKVIGHKKESTTMRYITVSEDERREAVKLLGVV